MSCERLGSLGRDVKTLFGAAFGRSNYANLCRRSEHIYGLDGTSVSANCSAGHDGSIFTPPIIISRVLTIRTGYHSVAQDFRAEAGGSDETMR